jgi:hypothetical protein
VSTSSPPTLFLIIAPERLDPMSGNIHTPRLQLDQFHPVICTLFELGEGMKMSDADMPSDDDIMQVLSSIEDLGIPRSANSYAHCTRPGTKWQRRQLLKLTFWSKWLVAKLKMMDFMFDDNICGKPVKKSSLSADDDVLSTVWNYSMKMNGIFKARTFCDGSRLKTKGIRYVEHYAACIFQCGMRLVFACCAIKNYVVLGVDAVNSYAQSPPHKTPSYVRLDAQYLD